MERRLGRGESGSLSDALVTLTRAIAEHGGEEAVAHGVLGGQWGYGAEFQNSVFEMHPFWWGDCTCGWDDASDAWEKAHAHDRDCAETRVREAGYIDWDDELRTTLRPAEIAERNTAAAQSAGIALDAFGSPSCTCSRTAARSAWADAHPHPATCPLMRPNFLHRQSRAGVSWYKYIGRGMSTDSDASAGLLTSLVREAIASLDAPSQPNNATDA